LNCAMGSLRVHPVAVLGFAFLTAMCSGTATERASNVVVGRDAEPDQRVEGGGTCTENDVSRCVAPPSECRDTNTLRYFMNPTCSAGRCNWQESTYSCPQCSNGGCLFTTTSGGVGSFGSGGEGSGGSGDTGGGDSSPNDAPDVDSASKDAATMDSSFGHCFGSDASSCVAPPSQCVSPTRLRYYVNPVCQHGDCVWLTQEYSCSYCMGGGCLGTTTAGGGP
jgi:hypothetical protein